jgi:hypothetical protein
MIMQCTINEMNRTITLLPSGQVINFEDVYKRGFNVIRHNAEYGEIVLSGSESLFRDIKQRDIKREEEKRRYLIDETISEFLGK